MKAVVVYESLYGNTHLIADAIADGLRHTADVVVASIHETDDLLLKEADLLVVGGPTHVHGMSRASTREAAVVAAEKPESELTIDPEAKGPGVREWLGSLDKLDMPAAAFDTRLDASAVLTGRASKGIARELRHHGCSLVAEPESFFVTKETHLEPEEEAHARRWGATLAALVGTSSNAR
jgi:menaquinone-dependent protoporphyrinogen IX oxidase